MNLWKAKDAKIQEQLDAGMTKDDPAGRYWYTPYQQERKEQWMRVDTHTLDDKLKDATALAAAQRATQALVQAAGAGAAASAFQLPRKRAKLGETEYRGEKARADTEPWKKGPPAHHHEAAPQVRCRICKRAKGCCAKIVMQGHLQIDPK